MRAIFKYLLFVCLCLPLFGNAQTFELEEGQKHQKIKFELINNLIVIPIEVNGVELSFILDSGVNKPILFNLSDKDSVQLRNVSEISIQGLGDGEPIKALSSKGNSFKLKKIANRDQILYVVLDREMNFSPSLGRAIHGIIGYDLFRDFVVDINYSSETIKFYSPKFYRKKLKKNEQSLPLHINKNKAFIEGAVSLNGQQEVPVKLLLDTGSSDAVWLFKDLQKGLGIPEKNYDDYLGKGLSGKIYGKRTKVHSVKLGDFVLKDAKAAFPDMSTFSSIKDLGNRNGSVGGEILRRFNVVFDYPNNRIMLRKNGSFHLPFHYNLAGIDLVHNGLRYIMERITDSRGVVTKSDERAFGDVQILFENRTRLSLVPEIIVSGIRAGSPAHEAGLKEGDVILAVNGKSIHRYKLQEVIKMLNEREGKRVRVLIERYNKDLTFSFVLKELFE